MGWGGGSRNPIDSKNRMSRFLKCPGCKLKRFWTMIRHGTLTVSDQTVYFSNVITYHINPAYLMKPGTYIFLTRFELMRPIQRVK